MDTQRLILFLIFSMSALFLWEAWQKHNRPPVPPTQQSAPAAPAAPGAAPAGKASDVPTATPALPAAPQASQGAAGAAPGAVPGSAPGTASAAAGAEPIHIRTDVFEVTVSPIGGVVTEVAMVRHRDAHDPSKPYVLLQSNANRTHVAQSGLLGDGMPNHRTPFTVVPGPRELAAGSDRLELRMTAPLPGGGKVDKVMTFKRGSYVIDVAYEITNGGSAPIAPYAYFQLTRDSKPAGFQHAMAPVSYTGPVLYNATDKFKKVDFSDIDKGKATFPKTSDNGWVGMIEQYFVSAWFPKDGAAGREFYARKVDNNVYSVGLIVQSDSIAPGATGRIDVPLYAGPQEQDTLKHLATGLDLVVDYGIFTVIAAPLFWLLQQLHRIVGNWGWAIVLLTVLIKGVFYPLNAAAARSMAKMKVVAPKMKALQEQYANDRQQLQLKMMEIYKQEKINPLGGCLPILVQIPVFIALYWVLLAAVELRQAPWLGWIKDLSAPDPFYILPVLYAITAWFQVKLTPQTPGMDPVQQKMLQYMPIAFSIMFVFFPAGLVLYWLVNNLLTIGQQWHVNRMLEKEAALAAARRR